ncbi:MAG: hypothetical protein IJ022_03080 [Burkholderiaceae bacterium]|nr:hypothetical protein [Burkholderiaceae bacterium]
MFKECQLVGKHKETEEITSFYFQPNDGSTIYQSFKPGQFVCVRPKGLGQQRPYSISIWAPNERIFRISVRRVENKAQNYCGVVSNYLHRQLQIGDKIDICTPDGDFYLSENDKPVTLIGAGVGITPIMTMLGALSERAPERLDRFIYICQDEEHLPMADDINYFLSSRKEALVRFYTRAKEGKPEERILSGRPNIEKYTELNLNKDSEFYICGSIPFMNSQKELLTQLGINESQIHVEIIPSA